MKGLVIESSAQIRLRILQCIETLNFVKTIYHADSHSSAEVFSELASLDFVLMDIDFQQNAAVDFVIKIKQDLPKCIVIAMGNAEDQVEVQKCKFNGVDFVLDKYHEFEKIPEVIALAADLHKCKNLYEKHPNISIPERMFAG